MESCYRKQTNLLSLNLPCFVYGSMSGVSWRHLVFHGDLDHLPCVCHVIGGLRGSMLSSVP